MSLCFKMENIVYNFAKITFQPKEVVLTENRSATTFTSTTTNIISSSTTNCNLAWSLRPTIVNLGSVNSNSNSGAMSDEQLDTTSDEEQEEADSQLSRNEDNDDDSDAHSSYSEGRRGGVARRRMPARVSKDNFNRVCSMIMKPNKKKRKEFSANSQTLKSIEKIYTSKRMRKFTPTNLETIFEEPSDENAADVEDDSEECAISKQVRLVKFGARKMRRAISFSDGLNKNKNLVKKRRQKVKKTFGKRFALKKITMTEFHDRLNKSFDSAMLEGDEEIEQQVSTAPKVTVTMDDMQLPALSTAVMRTGPYE